MTSLSAVVQAGGGGHRARLLKAWGGVRPVLFPAVESQGEDVRAPLIAQSPVQADRLARVAACFVEAAVFGQLGTSALEHVGQAGYSRVARNNCAAIASAGCSSSATRYSGRRRCTSSSSKTAGCRST